jgi:tetraacyldisaccharide 4'-kinase
VQVDEPLLIATQCQVPVYVARQRIQAARALLAQHPDTDVLV